MTRTGSGPPSAATTSASSGRWTCTRSSTPRQRPSRKLQLPGALADMGRAPLRKLARTPSAGRTRVHDAKATSTSVRRRWTASPRLAILSIAATTRQTWSKLGGSRLAVADFRSPQIVSRQLNPACAARFGRRNLPILRRPTPQRRMPRRLSPIGSVYGFPLSRRRAPADDGRRRRQRTRQVVLHPGAVVIMPLLDGDRVCLIRNERVAVGKTLIELPAGTLEPPEPPRRDGRARAAGRNGLHRERVGRSCRASSCRRASSASECMCSSPRDCRPATRRARRARTSTISSCRGTRRWR